jgi:tetratricopeptide (TPR) repeat protein
MRAPTDTCGRRLNDREIDDIFVIQEDISGQVVEELKLRLLGQQPLSDRVNPQAYDLFLQALYILNHGDEDDEVRRAESLLLQAIQLEPNFQAAISELARAYWVLSRSEPSGPYRQLRDEQIDRLVALDPDGSEANAWLAAMNTWEARRPRVAASYMEAANAPDPTNLRTLRYTAFFLTELGRTEEAIAVGKYIVRRDPACGSCVSALGNAYRRSGRHAEAVEALESILKWRPPDSQFTWHYGVALTFAGESEKALEWFEPGKDAGMGYAYLLALHELGRYEEFEERLAGEIERIDQNGGGVVARIYAWLGENDKAFEYLEMALADDPNMLSNVGNDFYRKIQSDPRWDELMSRYGIVSWEQLDIEFNPQLPAEIRQSLEVI